MWNLIEQKKVEFIESFSLVVDTFVIEIDPFKRANLPYTIVG